MSVRTALRIELANQPGSLGTSLSQIAQAGVNLEAVAGVATGETSILELLVADPTAALQALQQVGISATETQVAVVSLPHRVGALAHACEALAGAGINIDGIYVVVTDASQGAQVAFECPEASHAEQVLAAITF